METSAVITATTRTDTIVDNRTTRSLCLAKYIKNIHQVNKKTAIEHRYRLSRFERYIAGVFEQIQQLQQKQQQHQNQDQELERTRAGTP
jgi:hypothetical protein